MRNDQKSKEMAHLKRLIRKQMNNAARKGTLNGPDLLGVLMCVASEMVAKVKDDDLRTEFVESVVGFFPHAVDLARETPKVVLQ